MGERNGQKMGYTEDLRLEKKFTKMIKQILGLYFFVQDDFTDKKEGTDFMIYTAKTIRIGVRLRTHGYLERYWNQFTIRWSRPSGVETEIHKIRRGYVSHLFYGFVDKEEKRLMQYLIGDLDFLRFPNIRPREIKPNKPFDSELAVYYLSDFPREFVLKFWQSPEVAQAHPELIGVRQMELF